MTDVVWIRLSVVRQTDLFGKILVNGGPKYFMFGAGGITSFASNIKNQTVLFAGKDEDAIVEECGDGILTMLGNIRGTNAKQEKTTRSSRETSKR